MLFLQYGLELVSKGHMLADVVAIIGKYNAKAYGILRVTVM